MREHWAEWLYCKLETMQKKPGKILYNNAVRADLQTLEPAGDTLGRQRVYVIKKLSLCSIIVVCGVVLSIILWIKDSVGTQIVDNQIARNSYGEGSKQVLLVAEDAEACYEVPVTLSERCYSDEELTKMSKEALSILETKILGQNKSFDQISYDMCLLDSVDGYPFVVEWHTDDTYMEDTGRLVQDTLASPVLMELTAVLSCGSFEVEYDMSVRVYSKTIQPSLSERLFAKVSNQEEISRSQQNMTLPSEMESKT